MKAKVNNRVRSFGQVPILFTYHYNLCFTVHILAVSSLLIETATTLPAAAFNVVAQVPINSNFYQVLIK